MVLVKEAGFDLTDVTGSRTVHRRVRPPEGVIPRLREWLPFCSDPDPVVERHVEETPGMSQQEFYEFLVLHDEHESMKEDKADEQAREARRKAKSNTEGV